MRLRDGLLGLRDLPPLVDQLRSRHPITQNNSSHHHQAPVPPPFCPHPQHSTPRAPRHPGVFSRDPAANNALGAPSYPVHPSHRANRRPHPVRGEPGQSLSAARVEPHSHQQPSVPGSPSPQALPALPATLAVPALIALPSLPASPITGAGAPPDPTQPNTRPRHQPLPTTHQSRATSPVIPASPAGTQRHDQSQRNLSPRPRTHPERTSPAAAVIPSAAQRSRGISPSVRAPSPTRPPRRKLDTSPAKVDTSPSKLNTFAQKLDTSAPKLNTLARAKTDMNTSPDRLNTSQAAPNPRLPTSVPRPLPFMVSRPAVFGGPSRTTSRRPRRACPELVEWGSPIPGVPDAIPCPERTQRPDRSQSQPATPSTHASRAHLPLFSHFSLLSAHSFPSPLALRNHLVYTREAVSHALPRTLHAHPPPPTARPPDTPAPSPLFPHPASRPVSDQPLPLETPPPQPLATSAHPASLAPSCRPLTTPTFVANPPQKSGPSYLSPA